MQRRSQWCDEFFSCFNFILDVTDYGAHSAHSTGPLVVGTGATRPFFYGTQEPLNHTKELDLDQIYDVDTSPLDITSTFSLPTIDECVKDEV